MITRDTIPSQLKKATKSVNPCGTCLGAFILAIIAVVAFVVSAFNTADQNTQAILNSTPITVSAAQIIGDYANNQVAADDKYKNQLLEISGIVQSINTGLIDNPYIVVAPNMQTYNAIECEFSPDHEQSFAALNAGQNVTVEGIGDGYIISSVMVNNCLLVTP